MAKLEKKPFALIGLNVNAYSANKLKEVMVKENLNWRSTAAQGRNALDWNSPGTPTYYIIDSVGVIRYKWVGHPGANAIEDGLDKLLKQIE